MWLPIDKVDDNLRVLVGDASSGRPGAKDVHSVATRLCK